MYVLILTLAIKMGYAGMGGIAMHEFNSLEACELAAAKWEHQIKECGRVAGSEVMTLCVKKGD